MDHLATVRERIDALEQQAAYWQQQTQALEAHTHTVERRLRWWRGTALLVLVLGLVSWPLSGALTLAQEEAVTPLALTLEQRVAALENKLVQVTRVGTSLIITGANLHIRNGLNNTSTKNGVGNLIVGYNEPRSAHQNVRTGSHNVVVGREHDFSGSGGLVVGLRNTIGNYASVSGGFGNTASGASSAVSGGMNNRASANNASVSGGANNTASGPNASVGGGSVNTAGGDGASVSGGANNTASGDWSSVSGGILNAAYGNGSSASGGHENQATGDAASVSGGAFNAAVDDGTSVSGGAANTARGGGASISGGYNNSTTGDIASISGGLNRTALGDFDWVAGSLFQDQ